MTDRHRPGLPSTRTVVGLARAWFFPTSPYRPLTRYLAAVLAVALATLATRLLSPGLTEVATLPFLTAAVVSALVGGTGPGLLATGLSALALPYAIRSLHATGRWYEGGSGLVLFVVVSVMICALAGERRRAEASALDSRAFLQSTLDSLGVDIAVIDGAGTIVAANAAWRLAAAVGSPGLGSPGDVGTNYLEAWRSEAAGIAGRRTGDAIQDVLAGRRPELVAEYAGPGAAEQRWFEVRVRRFEGAGSLRAVVAHEDITERKQATEAERRAEALQSVGRLAGAVAHEINNPLAIILGNVEIVAQVAPRETGARIRLTLDAVERIRAVVSRMTRLSHLELYEQSADVPEMLDLRRSRPAGANPER